MRARPDPWAASPGAGRTGWAAAPLGWLLGGLYAALVSLRLALYALGVLRPRRAGRPVISVGNLTAGGSGKTPLVDYLLRSALATGLRPVCLTRGYGRSGRSDLIRVRAAEGASTLAESLGDEAALLARRNPQATLVVGRERAAAARLAEIWDDPQLFVLDDGYQHLRLHRDLNLLLVDAEQGLGNGRLLPRGPLREPASQARRADAVLITKANLAPAEPLRAWLRERLGLRVPIFTCDYRALGLTRLDGEARLPHAALAGRRVSLVCAIARPEGFARTVEALGARVERLLAYPDHHPYGPAELGTLAAALQAAPDEPPAWLTTEKDAVKLAGHLEPARSLWVLEMEARPEPAAEAFFFDFFRECGLN